MSIKTPTTKEYLKSSLQSETPILELNSKMISYLLNKEKDSYIFNLVKASNFLKLAGNILQKKAEKGYKFLFVGTDKLTFSFLTNEALYIKNYYINSRWLGGMLTNWQIIQKRIKRLILLEEMEKKKLSNNLKKKNINTIKKEIKRLNKLFIGIKNMKTFPQAVIFIDQIKNFSAIKECLKVGIPTITIIDNKCEIKSISYPVISKNKSILSIKFLIKYLSKKILDGYNTRRFLLYKKYFN